MRFYTQSPPRARRSFSLARRLGPYDAAAIIVSNVIGGGILFSPPQVAANVPHPWLFLATWLGGGALAFAGAMAYAELATLRPRSGGEYVYLDAAFGRLAAFLTGWTSRGADREPAVLLGRQTERDPVKDGLNECADALRPRARRVQNRPRTSKRARESVRLGDRT
ncbi:MAG: hypothetical protein DMF99_16695 [Acidobacteria bacterium]|nr:MAG: hypothetical protein DMF99_16695 [Acidobacteriota bacterium]